jgi:DNA-binding NarL/FixJ family response regulator
VPRTRTEHPDGGHMLTRELPALTANGARPPETHPERLVAVCVLTNQPVIRVGLTAMLDSPDISVRPVMGLHGDDADVVLLDVTLIDDEPGLAERCLASTTATVIAVDTMSRPDLSARARGAGIEWGITLGITPLELHEVVRAAAAGSRMTKAITSRWAQRSCAVEAAGLSRRETEVLRLITSGLSNPDIADQLSVSVNSVKTYIRSAYRKIDVTSRCQAVGWAMRHGLGTMSPETTGNPTARGRPGRS